MKSLKKLLVVFGITSAIVLITLMLTNPSLDRFKEYLPSEVAVPLDSGRLTISKTENWLIFSVFKYKLDHFDPKTYIGIFNNFFAR